MIGDASPARHRPQACPREARTAKPLIPGADPRSVHDFRQDRAPDSIPAGAAGCRRCPRLSPRPARDPARFRPRHPPAIARYRLIPAAMPQPRTINLHLVSDSTGETLNSIARATLARFDDPHVIHHRWSLIRSRLQLDRVLEGIEARARPGAVHPGRPQPAPWRWRRPASGSACACLSRARPGDGAAAGRSSARARGRSGRRST